MSNATKARSFHGQVDTGFSFVSRLVQEKPSVKHFVIQEREVGYRFFTHFHPYAGQLMQRLLRESIAGLQAADTKNHTSGAALPGSIEVALGKNAGVALPAGSWVTLLAKVQADVPGSASIEMPADTQIRLTNDVQATVPEGMDATLRDGMDRAQPDGAEFGQHENTWAVANRNTAVRLAAAAQTTLYDGKQATIPVGTQVLLLGGVQLVIPSSTRGTILRSRPLPELYAPIFQSPHYNPASLVQRPYPVKDLDFTYSGAYSVYNWELFFHVPITIAMHLSKNQRYAEAQRWFHYIFDPTDNSDGPTPERFWKVRPFQYTDVRKIETILVNLANNADPVLRDETVLSIESWRDAPFRPHVVARFRQQAYMYKTVMAYLDNLIAWGDSLFRQDTGESIDEALMLYVMAANILGPRPLPVPRKGTVRPQTYASLRVDLDRHFGNAMRAMEPELAFDLMPLPAADGAAGGRLAPLRSLGRALYFCVPRNDKLLGYWDTVADRLFKIRNSLNIQGIYRQLALFEPPIDPAMLARAAAAGLDVGAIVNGLNQPLPLVRFQLLAQKASEICQEVKALGNNLLSAMEKEDGEAMAILRARHERTILEMAEQVRYAQWQEAIKSKEGLLKSLALAVQRYTYYERQLGRKPEEIAKSVPELGELDRDTLEKMKFAMTEPEMAPRDIEVDIATDILAQAAQLLNGGKILSSHEVRETLLMEGAQLLSDVANVLNLAGALGYAIPTAKVHVQPMGCGGTVEYGGKNVGDAVGAAATASRGLADRLNFEARRASRIDSFARRERDWAFQSNLAGGEITQVFKQLRAAQIREAVTELELRNHRRQMEHAKEIERFLNAEGTEKNGKKTNKSLYTWIKREVKGLYGQCFQFAFDAAKKAERALQHELGNPGLTFLQFGYLGGKEGLLAGDKLYLDIKRMEMAYHDLNRREYELTKHVSLSQVDPMALMRLRATGRCTVALPEALFDLDGPGHYFRRIKSVALSIPCVTGPYVGVNCTLTLLKSRIRKSPALRGGVYVREGEDDDRFSDYFGSMQSIVASSSQNDSGMFEPNLRDERYLPFEGSGALSEWRLELPADPSNDDPCLFDYGTISDVILHIRYVAREGGGPLRAAAIKALKTTPEGSTEGRSRLFSVRHDFPTEWAAFRNGAGAPPRFKLNLPLSKNHYPFWSQEGLKKITRLDILAPKGDPLNVLIGKDAAEPALELKETLGKDLVATTMTETKLTTLSPAAALELSFNKNTMKDLWIVITWS